MTHPYDPAPLDIELAQAPLGGAAHWVHTSDGVRLRLAHWMPNNPKGTVLLCPGRTEYIEKYGHTVSDFTKMGLAVVVIDWRGQGLSDRLIPNRMIGHVEQFSDFQTDVAAMQDYVAAFDLPQPLFSCAHSMGGAIMLRALMNGLPVKAAVFSAPMWGIMLNTVMRAAAWSVTTVANPFRVRDHLSPGADSKSMVERGKFDENRLTTDPAMFDFMVHQLQQKKDFELVGPSIAWLGTALREMRTMAGLPSPKVPCLTFVGTDEDIVDPDAIGSRMAKWPDGQLDVIEGAKHEVMMEIAETRARFFAKTRAHFGL